MFHLRETNPHFQSRQLPYPQTQPPRPQDASDFLAPIRAPPLPQSPQPSQPQDGSDLQAPMRTPPQPQDSSDLHAPLRNPSQPQPRVLPPASRPKLDDRSQIPPPRHPRRSQPRAAPISGDTDHEFRPSSLRVPAPRKTRRITWLAAICCVVFWVLVIVGGLILLIIYLVYHPRLPKFDISSASLNAAYLDMGYLLNADMNLLANFTNPNKKVNVDFNHMVINLYFEGALIATRFIDPLSVASENYKLSNVHMVTSQVAFSRRLSRHLSSQMDSGRIVFEIKGYFKTKSNLGSFLSYSYWLYGHCNFVVSGPPSGVMIAKKCVTKR